MQGCREPSDIRPRSHLDSPHRLHHCKWPSYHWCHSIVRHQQIPNTNIPIQVLQIQVLPIQGSTSQGKEDFPHPEKCVFICWQMLSQTLNYTTLRIYELKTVERSCNKSSFPTNPTSPNLTILPPLLFHSIQVKDLHKPFEKYKENPYKSSLMTAPNVCVEDLW